MTRRVESKDVRDAKAAASDAAVERTKVGRVWTFDESAEQQLADRMRDIDGIVARANALAQPAKPWTRTDVLLLFCIGDTHDLLVDPDREIEDDVDDGEQWRGDAY